MKKWLLVIFLLILTIISGIYFFIPAAIAVKSSIRINTTRSGVYRMLQDKNSYSAWWPGTVQQKPGVNELLLHGYHYSIGDNNISVIPVGIAGKGLAVTTSLYMIAPQTEVVQMEWVTTITTGSNPLTRISRYFAARKLRSDMDIILSKMNVFFSKPENIYSYKVNDLTIVDSTFIYKEDTSRGYPSTAFIYSLISNLRAYAKPYQTKETSYPILNIEALDSPYYLVKVALPLDKALPSSGNIFQKRMPVNVKILMMETRGGAATAAIAFQQLFHYINDHHLSIPGMPFYSLVTDRSAAQDTSKWITRIYYPVRY